MTTIAFLARRAGILATLALLAAPSGPLFAQDAAKDPVVAKVNGIEIRQSDLAIAEEEAGQLPAMSLWRISMPLILATTGSLS